MIAVVMLVVRFPTTLVSMPRARFLGGVVVRGGFAGGMRVASLWRRRLLRPLLCRNGLRTCDGVRVMMVALAGVVGGVGRDGDRGRVVRVRRLRDPVGRFAMRVISCRHRPLALRVTMPGVHGGVLRMGIGRRR